MISLNTIIRNWLRKDRQLREHFLIEKKNLGPASVLIGERNPFPILCKCSHIKAGEVSIRKIPGWVHSDKVNIVHIEPMTRIEILMASDPSFFEYLRKELVFWHASVVHPGKCTIEQRT